MAENPIITFASDFGVREYYVGAVKGSILSINPEAHLIDTSHEIPSHDLLAGAFTIAGYFDTYPLRTIHLVVVDPEVGSERRALIVQTDRYSFIAPDNGILSLAMARSTVSRVIAVEAEHYYRKPVSPTFHARDIFGPIAGWLSKGIGAEKFGNEISDYKQMSIPEAKIVEEGTLEGFVLHIDKFGNLVTNFSEQGVNQLGGLREDSHFVVNDRKISEHVAFYAEGKTEVFSLVGSNGYLEIAANKKPASRLLDAKRGMKIYLYL